MLTKVVAGVHGELAVGTEQRKIEERMASVNHKDSQTVVRVVVAVTVVVLMVEVVEVVIKVGVVVVMVEVVVVVVVEVVSVTVK